MLRNVSRLALRSNFARQATMGQRFYSVARPDAEKRIAAVLESFDKVSFDQDKLDEDDSERERH